MTYEDILFLIGFFLVIAFFVGCKHKPATLSGWLAFCLSFLYCDASYIGSSNLVRLSDA